MFSLGHHHRHGRRFSPGVDGREDGRFMFGGRGGRGGFGPGVDRGVGRGMGRFFEQGAIRLVVLGLIEEKPRHGYEIIKAVEDRMQGAYSPSPGLVYPTLSMLEEQGLIAATAEGAKKLYGLTDEGRAFLESNRQMVDGLFARMAAAGGAAGGAGRDPSVVRAMQNLRVALQLRMARGGVTPDAATAIAAALDAAATTIERT